MNEARCMSDARCISTRNGAIHAVSEITEVLSSQKTPAVEEKVDKALERCFATKVPTNSA